jgi:hypothetical protein
MQSIQPNFFSPEFFELIDRQRPDYPLTFEAGETAGLLDVTAPVRVEGESDAQTIFTWMVANRYLWMLDGEWADRAEDLVGTARLIRLAGRRMRFRREQPAHEALRLPDEDSAREVAYRRLARFLEMHIILDDAVNVSRGTPAQPGT